MKLSQAREEFPINSLFLSATGNIKKPLTVVKLMYAQHEDRKERIKNIEKYVLNLHNKNFYPKFVNSFSKLDLSLCGCKEELEEREYLLSLKRDIINEEGGVIFCGETNSTAKKC